MNEKRTSMGIRTRRLSVIRAFSLFGLAAALMWTVMAGCGNLGNSGASMIEGDIKLGGGLFLSPKARRIVVGIYNATDFDKEKGMPKTDAKFLRSVELTNLQAANAYHYKIDTNGINGYVMLFAFLDQDDSGSRTPSAGDAYGFKTSPIFPGGYHLKNMIVSLDKVIGGKKVDADKPGVDGEVKLERGYSFSDKAKVYILLYEEADFDFQNDRPKAGKKAVTYTEIKDLKAPPYKFSLTTKNYDRSMFLFVHVDQDASGRGVLSPGDLFGVPKGNPMYIDKQRKSDLTVTIEKSYRPAIQIELDLGKIKPSKDARRAYFGFWRETDVDDKKLPKKGKSALILRKFDLNKAENKWKLTIEPGKETAKVYPFFYLDQDNSSSFNKDDAYATWSDKVISLETSTDKAIKLTLSKTYSP